MIEKKLKGLYRLGILSLKIAIVFGISGVFCHTSFAAGKVCNESRLRQQARSFNRHIDPELNVSISVESCKVALKGRDCENRDFTAYQLTTLPRLPDPALLQQLNIQSFGRNPTGPGYILAIPKCAG